MADNLRYWLWLQKCLGASAKLKKVLYGFTNVVDFYNAGEAGWVYAGVSESKAKLLSSVKTEDFDELIELCRKYRIHILTPDSELYPQALLETEDFPAVLFLRGNPNVFYKKRMIGVIGSRTPCVYGEQSAVKITERLVHENTVIVSGGALGIDSVAHRTAIQSGGQTVLVLGCGHGVNYLPENAELRKKVAYNGAIISEYPPYTPTNKGSFQKRNRIISGVSEGVVIVEAAEVSGTFSTARHVKAQGRPLFVLPGDIESGNFSGSNRLITEGALPVFSGEDILSYFEPDRFLPKYSGMQKTGVAFKDIEVQSLFSKKKKEKPKSKVSEGRQTEEKDDNKEVISENSQNIKKINTEAISKNALIVYNIMSDGVSELEEIKRLSSLEVRNVLVALTELELEGVACSDGPNRYKLV